MKSELTQAVVEGETYWMPASLPDLARDASDVYLLPGFHEYLLGYADRGAVLDPQHFRKIVTGANGVFNPTVVVGGRVEGVWKRTVRKGTLEVNPVPFTSWSGAQKHGIVAAAERYGTFVGMPVRVLEVQLPCMTSTLDQSRWIF